MDPDENRADFELLTSRWSDDLSGGSSRASSAVADHEVWPLSIRPSFVDHYMTGESVGSGSYAQVYECIDTRTLERCAMKVVDKAYLRRQAPTALSNQLREIRLLRHLHHPNIISMRECLHRGPKIHIILEYCPFALSDLLADQPDNKLNISVARDLFHQLCYGLQHLHSLGIVHRDIKPQNLLITNCGLLKIIDFGVSHILSIWNTSNDCSNYEGSPLFQAPEVVCGQASYSGFKVDVWSSGVTLYLMLFGAYPFMDEALLMLYDRILGQDFEMPNCAPNELILTDLIAIMLDKDASRRASIEQVLEHPWLQLKCFHSYAEEHVEFVDLVTSRQQPDLGQATSGGRSSARRDVYSSMSVLPYLYRHHFPLLPVTKAARRRSPSGSTSQSSAISSVDEQRPAIDRSIGEPSSSGPMPAREPTDDPNRILAHHDEPSDDAEAEGGRQNRLEWGTREQYELLRVPPVRANRVINAARRRKRRTQHRPGQS